MIVVTWIIAVIVAFVPMPFMYKIIGIIISIILIAVYTYIASSNHRLSKTNLVINLIIIGWDLAEVYRALVR